MPGGQTSTTNSTQVADKTPWSVAIPGLQTALNSSANLYNSGVGSQVYGGQRVADLTPDQQQGLQSVQDQFNADNSAGIALTGLQNIVNSNGGVSYSGPQLDSNGLSAGTVGALGQLGNVQGANLGLLNNFIGSTYGDQSPINQTANSFMDGSRDINTGGIYNGLLGYNNQASASEKNLQGVASGQYLDPTTNPYIQAAVASSNTNAADAQKAAFAASGRYGSGDFSAAMAKAINDTDTQLYANQYNTEASRQLQANQLLDAQQNARVNQGGVLANDLTNLGSLNNQQRLSGAGLLQNQNAQQLQALGTQLGGQEFNSGLDLSKATAALGAYQQGTANAMSNAMNAANTSLASQAQALQAAQAIPGVDASRYAPAAQLLQAGSVQQAQNQSYLDAAQQYFQDTQSVPWQALSQYASFPLAIGSQGGTQVTNGTSQTQTSGPSLGQTLLGGGLGLLSLGTGGGTTLGGGLLKSGLGSLFGSDERMKTDVREVGELHDGQKVYSYRYGDDPRTQIGLLAGEVQKARPDAVGPIGLGDLLGVDYRTATDDAAQIAARDGKKGGGGSSGGSAPAAPPAGLLAALSAQDDAPTDRPRVMVMVQGYPGSERQDADTSARIGAAVVSALSGGLLGDAARSMIPQEHAPIRRDRPKAPASGKRRVAA